MLFYIFLNVYNSRCHKLLFKPLSDILKEVPATNHWALLVAGSDTWDNYRHQVVSFFHHYTAEQPQISRIEPKQNLLRISNSVV